MAQKEGDPQTGRAKVRIFANVVGSSNSFFHEGESVVEEAELLMEKRGGTFRDAIAIVVEQKAIRVLRSKGVLRGEIWSPENLEKNE